MFMVLGCVTGGILVLEFPRRVAQFVLGSLALALSCQECGADGLLVLHTITRRFQELEYHLKIGNEEADPGCFFGA